MISTSKQEQPEELETTPEVCTRSNVDNINKEVDHQNLKGHHVPQCIIKKLTKVVGSKRLVSRNTFLPRQLLLKT